MRAVAILLKFSAWVCDCKIKHVLGLHGGSSGIFCYYSYGNNFWQGVSEFVFLSYRGIPVFG